MDIELLRTFLEVSQTRHFGRAADKLFITPAAVSARIRQLEQSLGVSLFYRTRGNNQMTPEGERLLPHAHQMLRAWEEARKDLARQAEPSQLLQIGAPPELWQYLLPELPARLRQENPQLTLRVESGSAEELLERLQVERMDLALLYNRPDDPSLRVRRLGEVAFVLLSPEPGLTVKSALAGDYIAMDWGPAFSLFQAKRFGEVEAWLHTNQVGVAVAAMRRRSASAYLPAVLEGMGVESVERKNDTLHRVDGAPVFSRALCGVCRAERVFSPGVRAAMALLEEEWPSSNGQG